MSKSEYRFEIAISFAGDNKRDVVRKVAKLLQAKLGAGKVFFDEWFEAELAGLDAQVVLQTIYTKKTRVVVTCVCQRYNEKPWTQEEWRAIQAFERGLRDAGTENVRRMRFLPLRFGDGEIDGLFATAIVPDVRQRSPQEIAELILDRLTLARASASSTEVSEPWTITVGRNWVTTDSERHLSNIITEVILAHESGSTLPEVVVNLEELANIEVALSGKGADMPNGARLDLTRQVTLLKMLKQYIQRSIRILAIAGRNVLFDPDAIAKCFHPILCELTSRCGLDTEEDRAYSLSIDVFRNDNSGTTIIVPLDRDEVGDVLNRLGHANPPLSVLQTPHCCSELPPDIRSFKAFPAMIVAVVWNRAREADDTGAAELCDYDDWCFGLA